jgi:uncharacterized membrane protein
MLGLMPLNNQFMAFHILLLLVAAAAALQMAAAAELGVCCLGRLFS